MAINYLEAILDWCKTKVPLADKKSNLILKEGEVWWCSIGMNIGEEEYGKGGKFTRPVLIFRKFTPNLFLGLPLTTKEKEGSWYVPVNLPDRERWAILDQARVFDRKRLSNRIGNMKEADFVTVAVKFSELYCPVKVVTPLRAEAGINGQGPNFL